jgi:hypothetical protein
LIGARLVVTSLMRDDVALGALKREIAEAALPSYALR